ncbi:alpha-galactosidase [Longilinea arvoryzae]|uniref:Alpha-galactosidase n=1 Tax=Longilinea arvoryzae TaxID=360412 RepID=A0A0S7BIY2_9CHLR|nr:glycoside hydrolase family 36 protein [Longilinea arvoryzae]GAP14146.1 alpha-galactosidase [Longilinea arvoryzae]
MIELHNRTLNFTCHPESGTFTLQPADEALPALLEAHLALNYRSNGRSAEFLNGLWTVSEVTQLPRNPSLLGLLNQVDIQLAPDASGILCRVTFALSDLFPMLLWKISLENQGPEPITLDRIEMLRCGGTRQSGVFRLPPEWAKTSSPAFFSNNWQSWGWTGAYAANQKAMRSRLGWLQNPMVVNPGTPQFTNPGDFSSDFFGVVGDRAKRVAALFGFLSQRSQFGILEARLKETAQVVLWANGDQVRIDPGVAVQTDWAVYYPFSLEQTDPLGPYFIAASRENRVSLPEKIPSGWCSWYQFYTKIDAGQIRQNLESLQQLAPHLPLQLVQIDDGFEAQVGDWFEFRPGFPDGVAPLAAEIQGAGYTPGLWLAPFIVHPAAKLVKQHPEFILRNRLGRPVNAGFGWNALTTALDLTHPGALEYACKVIETARRDWGFPYLKLDFLYAGALAGRRHDPTLTRAQILRGAMEAVRKTANSDTFLVGCGAPLGSVIGLVDSMRIGADVSGSWTPNFNGIHTFFKNEPDMPSARNSIQNILTRAPMHNRWWINDPDCLLIRPETELTQAEVQTLATSIALTGGSLLLSDDLPNLPRERLAMAEVLLPVIGERADVLDWFDSAIPQRLRLDLHGPIGRWHLLAWFNWSEKPQDVTLRLQNFRLPVGDYWGRNFWDNRSFYVLEGAPFRFKQVPAHGVVLIALRAAEKDVPVFVGGNFHISQGLEISSWNVSGNGVNFDLSLPRRAYGEIEIALPRIPHRISLNQQTLSWEGRSDNCYRLRLNVDRKSHVEIGY